MEGVFCPSSRNGTIADVCLFASSCLFRSSYHPFFPLPTEVEMEGGEGQKKVERGRKRERAKMRKLATRLLLRSPIFIRQKNSASASSVAAADAADAAADAAKLMIMMVVWRRRRRHMLFPLSSLRVSQKKGRKQQRKKLSFPSYV